MSFKFSDQQVADSKAMQEEILKATAKSEDGLVIARALGTVFGSVVGIVDGKKNRESLFRFGVAVAHSIALTQLASDEVLANPEMREDGSLEKFKTLFNAAVMRGATETMSQIMQLDHDIAWAWQCNMACAYQDEGAKHEQANRAAARFMELVFKVDVTQFEQWKAFSWA